MLNLKSLFPHKLYSQILNIREEREVGVDSIQTKHMTWKHIFLKNT